VVRKKTIKQKIKVWGFSRFNFLKKMIPPTLLNKFYKLVSTSDYAFASKEHRAILRKITNYDLSPELKRIDCPSLVVWAERDEAITNNSKFMVEEMKNAQLRVIYGAGHNMYLEKQEELGVIINNFLKNGITTN